MKDRIRQFEAYLAHSLEAFKLRHENEVTRIPRVIRSLTIAEFADKYNGDVNMALQAITKARMEASGEPAGLDGSARKRYVICCTFFSLYMSLAENGSLLPKKVKSLGHHVQQKMVSYFCDGICNMLKSSFISPTYFTPEEGTLRRTSTSCQDTWRASPPSSSVPWPFYDCKTVSIETRS